MPVQRSENMEVKDWVTLFFPILCNGILLFVLTKLFETKQRKNLDSQTAKQKLDYKYKNFIEEILQIYCIEDTHTILQLLDKKFALFFTFTRENKVRLQEYATNITNMHTIWTNVLSIIDIVQNNEDGIIKGKNEKEISFWVDKLFDELVETAQICIKNIYERGDYAL